MNKIITLFLRNYDGDHLVRNEVTPGAEWVINGEGTPTRKIDGTCCMFQDSTLYKRYDAKKGKTPPEDFTPAQPKPDPITGHWPGWVFVKKSDPANRYHIEAFERLIDPQNGTYELVGPKIQGNPEKFDHHYLIPHNGTTLLLENRNVPRDFEGLKNYLYINNIEGIVWHHPDGRMVKIKKKDFGFKR